MNRCDTYIAGLKEGTASEIMADAIEKICSIVSG
jgi:hypothetical protein